MVISIIPTHSRGCTYPVRLQLPRQSHATMRGKHGQQSHIDNQLGVAMGESIEKGAGDGGTVVIFR
jgi:hypothetical protein